MRDGFTCSPWPAVNPAAGEDFHPEVAHLHGWASLLEWFYQRSGLELPRLHQLKPERVPQPYSALLVHSSDMTPTLENFFRQPLGLTVLSRDIQDQSYRREVVLTLGCEMRPILYGAIRIVLDRLPDKARLAVLEERFPLGHILQTEAIAHLSWPQAFFRAEPDMHMTAMLGLGRVGDLYGRRNVLVDGSRRLLAEVIEVLAPLDASGQAPQPNSRDSKL
jgi:chorismate-pyruvate lyase